MEIALFIGRFQPLHKGHVYAIKQARKRYHVIVVVGSINKKNEKNPFSFLLRKKMLLSQFPSLKIVGMRDTSNKEWVKKIKRKKFDVIISSNGLVRRLLKDCRLEKPSLLQPGKYNGTKIRSRMKKDQSVKTLVPKKVVEIIENS